MAPSTPPATNRVMASYKATCHVPTFLNQLQLGIQAANLDAPARGSGRAGPLVLAISGGIDSMALLHGLVVLGIPAPRLLAVHVNHQLRADESDADAAFVRQTCEQLHVPCRIVQVDVAERMARGKTSVEEAARDLRYQQLQKAADDVQAHFILTAHHASDQAETVLHHLIRGSGLRGLAGMSAQRAMHGQINLVRPMLQTSRDHIKRFVADRGIAFRQDQSNDDPAFTRNKIRHQLIPFLQETFHPQVEQRIQSLATQAAETIAWLDECADALLQSALLERQATSVRLNLSKLAGAPAVVCRNLLVRLWQHQQWPRQKMTAQHWQRLWSMTQPSGPTAIDLPAGLRAERRKNGLHLFEVCSDARGQGSTVPVD